MKVPCRLMNISDSPTEEKSERDLTFKMNKQQMTAKTGIPHVPMFLENTLKQSSWKAAK